MGFLSNFDNAITFLLIVGVIFILTNILLVLSKIFKRKIPRRIRYRRGYRYLPIMVSLFDIFFIVISFTTIQYNFTTSPVVVSRYPLTDETWYDLTKPLTVTFDRPIKASEIATSIFPSLKGNWKIEDTGGLIKFPRKVSFYPSESFPVDQKITIYFTKVQNFLANKNGFDHEDHFKSPSLPNITQTIPADQSTQVPVASPFVLTLDNPDGPYALWSAKLSPDVPLKLIDTKSNIMQVSFDKPLAQNTTYTLTVNRGTATYNFSTKTIENKTDLKPAKIIQFKTVPNPTIASSSPSGDHADPKSSINIIFNDEMNRASVESNFSINPKVDGKFNWIDNKNISFIPNVPLIKGTNYIVSLKTGITSKMGGVIEAEIKFDFTIIGHVKVTNFSPSNGTSNVSPTSPISLTFDQNVDHDSAQSKFAISPNTNGSFSWNGNTMAFNPLGMNFSTNYTFTENTGVKSIDGLDSPSSFSISITTQPEEVVLNVPQYYQVNKYDCNLTAARMVLAFRNIYVNQDDIVASIGYAQPQDRNGNIWGDPNVGYVGYRNGPGYGVNWGPISKYISQTRQNKIYTGWDVKGIAHEIAKGNPVILWWNNGLAGDGADTWSTPNGTQVNGFEGMHSEVVVGFKGSVDNPTGMILNDPWRGRRVLDIGYFNSLWSTFNNTAIAIY